MNPGVLLLFLLTMCVGTTIALSSTHWLVAWIGLEMNALAILPIMIHKSNPRAVEATTKYFVVQATGAVMIFFTALGNSWHTGLWEIQQTLDPIYSVLFTLALALKLGLAPLHLWMPEVLQGVNFTTGLILCTWQKIAPFCLLLQLHLTPPIAIALGILSGLVGGWGGMNQTQLRKMIAYSSIAHLGWMMVIMQFLPPLSLFALLFYVLLTTAVFMSLMMTSSTTVNALVSACTKSMLISIMLPLALLSLGGLPPLTGFMPKWIIIQELTKQDASMTAIMMIPSALLSLFFYVRIAYFATLTVGPNNAIHVTPWRLSPLQVRFITAFTAITSVKMLPLMPLIKALIF